MPLEKMRKVFDAIPANLPEGCFGFAQSPQAVEHPDFFRVYFSTRIREANNNYVRSVISYADFSKGDFGLLATAEQPSLLTGDLGTFDEHGIFPLNPLRIENRLLGYTTGWSRRVSTSVETAIGLVESFDGGKTFTRSHPGPLMAASLNEPCLVGDAFVTREDDQFRMWYIFGTGWKNYEESSQPERIYKIAYAASSDGLDWARNGKQIIEDRLGPDECQALPTVLKHNGSWHMVFCYRDAQGFRSEVDKGYRLGYARSSDGIDWVRNDEAIASSNGSSEWDCDMQCYPHLFLINNVPHLLYNGNNFGRDGFGLARLNFD